MHNKTRDFTFYQCFHNNISDGVLKICKDSVSILAHKQFYNRFVVKDITSLIRHLMLCLAYREIKEQYFNIKAIQSISQ